MIMGSGNLSSRNEASEVEEKGAQKISVVHHQMNGLEYTTGHEADSFIVDIERFSSHVADKDIANANSRITRSLSRKGSQRAGGEKKTVSSINTERHNTTTNITTSPRVTAAAALHAAITPEKPTVVVVGATNHSPSQPVLHNAITIMTGCGGAITTESKNTNRRFSFRRSSTSWTIDPRRILFFFATISSMGTILLIYFTLSMSKLSADDSGLN